MSGTLFYGGRVGGVGSGKYAPCRTCGKSIEQPPGYPDVAQEWCDAKCEAAESSGDDDVPVDPPRGRRSHAAAVHAAMVAKYGPASGWKR